MVTLISFVLREAISAEVEKEKLIQEPLTAEQMSAKARECALSLQRMGFSYSKNNILTKCLVSSEKVLAEVRRNIDQAETIEQTITTSAEWILDNNHVIQGTIEEIKRNLPRKYYNELPVVIEGKRAGLPRIYLVATDLVNCTANRLSKENIIAYLNSFQSVEPLTIGELWAFALMLRFRLIECVEYFSLQVERRLSEGEYASFWGSRLLSAAHREPERLAEMVESLKKENPHPSEHFAEELLDHLFDEEAAIALVKNWFEQYFHENVTDLIRNEQMRKTAEQAALSNALISLIFLSHLPWREVFEAVCQVDQILLKDPTEIYAKMDFTTRDSYRHVVELIAHRSKRAEIQIAQSVLELANNGKDGVSRHVGYYLIDKGLPELERKFQYKPDLLHTVRKAVYAHPAASYLGSIILVTLIAEFLLGALMWSSGLSLAKTIILALLALIPVSEPVIQLLNLLFTRIMPPDVLPKMRFEGGVPQECKTLIVMPCLLLNDETVAELVNRLEVHYLANPDPQFYFALLADFADAPKQEMKNDQSLLDKASKGIEALEKKYGPNKFFLAIRPRTFSVSEQAWIGWERKRGKLESLNRFLIDPSYSGLQLIGGQREALKSIRYVITLDADTQLPKERATQLVETMAHPLNAPQLNAQNRVERGYGIIQPRVTPDLMQGRLSWFAHIFADVESVNPYSQAVSDIYQDIAHEGIYHGKGIYDLHVFYTVLSGQFPEEHILSHDLLEGAYVRTGFASDISLYDTFPKTYLAWSKRQHRWMRGDWQIISWLFAYVPGAGHKMQLNPLSLLNRWKILDNVRRALFPVAALTLLITAWFFDGAWFWSAFVAAIYFFPAFFDWRGSVKCVINIALMPYQAFLSLSAALTVWYRRHISHRHLLEWQSTESHVSEKTFIFRLLVFAFLAVMLFLTLLHFKPSVGMVALPFCFLWLISPLIVSFLDTKPFVGKTRKISAADRLFLRKCARKTWRYFDDFMDAKSNWLPPDNYQSALFVEVAQRTSPTNIGLGMLSALAAYDLHYITADQVIERISATIQTLKKLELYEGHWLNWYDTQTLKPLYPRYVSTVDSGNLLACFWTIEQGLYQLLAAPLMSPALLEGLMDTFNQINSEVQTELADVKKMFLSKPENTDKLIFDHVQCTCNGTKA